MLTITLVLHALSIGISGGLSLWFWGSVRAFFCMGGFVLSSFVSLYVWKRYGSFDRVRLWQAARVSSYWIWGLSILGYVVLYHIKPEHFSFSANKLWFIAPCIALAPGFAALVIMLCAGDLVLFIFGEEKNNNPKSF